MVQRGECVSFYGANGTDAMFLYVAGVWDEFAGELSRSYEREKRK